MGAQSMQDAIQTTIKSNNNALNINPIVEKRKKLTRSQAECITDAESRARLLDKENNKKTKNTLSKKSKYVRPLSDSEDEQPATKKNKTINNGDDVANETIIVEAEQSNSGSLKSCFKCKRIFQAHLKGASKWNACEECPNWFCYTCSTTSKQGISFICKNSS